MSAPSTREPIETSAPTAAVCRRGATSLARRVASIVSLLAPALALALAAAPDAARALSFQADFVSSTYQVQAGDTFSDLLAEHQSSTLIQSNVVTGLENISTGVHAAGVNSNYSVLMSVDMDLAVGGSYSFQVGTDWGRGGATALIDNNTGSIVSELVRSDDVWWDYDWSHPDVFETTFVFNPGDSYTLMWVGFEGCCGGTSTVRFSVDGSAYAPLDAAGFGPYTAAPEPGTAVLLGLGLFGLASVGRRQQI